MPRPPAQGVPTSIARIRRQMLLERLLVDVVGVPWSRAHVEADRIGPAVSARVEARIASLLGDPGTCPHGNPIPGSPNAPSQVDAIPLSEADGLVSVTRVDDHIEEDVEAMELLEAGGVIPGQLAEVTGNDGTTVTVVGSSANVLVPVDVAAGVFVTPAVIPA